MKTLYIISRTPFLRGEARLPLRLADGEDGILLIQDGVILCQAAPENLAPLVEQAKSRGVKFYACEEDIAARGIKGSFAIVNYDGILDLFEKYQRIA